MVTGDERHLVGQSRDLPSPSAHNDRGMTDHRSTERGGDNR
jgi:hypothetical protein